MSDRFTKAAARNIFYGGSAFFFLLFVGLTAHSVSYAVNTSTDTKTLTESVGRGKRVWEQYACVNCHTILGEGAYFAPEIGNVWIRYGGVENPKQAREQLINWMETRPGDAPGRRKMPQFNLNKEQLNDLVDFLEWTSRMNTQNWPPNNARTNQG